MKQLIVSLLLLPCIVRAQIKTDVSYTIPAGFTSAFSFYTSESDAPVLEGQTVAGQHTIAIQTAAPATGFLYLAGTRQFIPFVLNGQPKDISKRLSIPAAGDEDVEGGAADVFPLVLQRFLNETSVLKYLGYVPDAISDSAEARAKVKQYYARLKTMAAFADSVVTLYPANNASLFTVFRLAHWCSFSPEVYTIFNKLDPTLLKSDFAKELAARQQQLLKDSMDVAGKKPGMGLQIVANNPALSAAGAKRKLFIYWDDYSHLDADLIEDVKRLHLLFGSHALQINFVYTGTTKNWQPMIKQAGMPLFANYVHCSKIDQLGASPVLAAGDNTCILAAIRGYNLYRKINYEEGK